MVSSKQSPIVFAGTARDTRRFLRYQSVSVFEYKDVMLLLLFCFALYGVAIYYVLPNVGPSSYRQAAHQLSYQWQSTWYSVNYTFSQFFFSLTYHSLLSEWYQYLMTPW